MVLEWQQTSVGGWSVRNREKRIYVFCTHTFKHFIDYYYYTAAVYLYSAVYVEINFLTAKLYKDTILLELNYSFYTEC
jgi:hypothetical protein